MAGLPDRARSRCQRVPRKGRPPLPGSRWRAAAIACLLIIAPAGCADIKARDAWLRNGIDDAWERVEAKSRSERQFRRPFAVLARQRLLAQAQEDPPRQRVCSRLVSKPNASPMGRSLWPNCVITPADVPDERHRSWRWPGTATPPFLPRWPLRTRPLRSPTWLSRSITTPWRG